ncbi:MAG: TerB family tellurite resistance protein [Rhodospirillales bacterium]|nr:MAG: TerB family tellurite resistance protein [Rhodospirillales bacterium]
MPGIKNIILGVLLAAAGGGVYVAVDLGDSVLGYVVWGLIGCGAILFIGGLYRALGPEAKGADATEAYKSDTIARLVMQSTIMTALADGPLDDEEIEMIVTACESVVHERLDKESIRRVAKVVESRGEEILHEIHSEGQMLNPDARKALFDACVLVLTADHKVDIRQTAAVTAIARQLGFGEDEAQAMLADAMKEADTG